MADRVDRLTGLPHCFRLHDRVLHNGVLSGPLDLEQHQGAGHLHLLRQGTLEVPDPGGGGVHLRKPSAVFYPRSWRHRIVADATGAEVLSAAIDFGLGDENPLLRGLAAMMCLPPSEMSSLDATLGILFVEATSRGCGHPTVLDRLTEVLLVHLLRYGIKRLLIEGGVVAGLADARLARALTAMHDDPAHDWTLASLAAKAGMSSTRFAARFATVVGVPAMGCLMRWRIGVAQGLLRHGRRPKMVAREMGYGRSSTFGAARSLVSWA
jgi:AraC-like DNA-binding protein